MSGAVARRQRSENQACGALAYGPADCVDPKLGPGIAAIGGRAVVQADTPLILGAAVVTLLNDGRTAAPEELEARALAATGCRLKHCYRPFVDRIARYQASNRSVDEEVGHVRVLFCQPRLAIQTRYGMGAYVLSLARFLAPGRLRELSMWCWASPTICRAGLCRRNWMRWGM